MWRRSKMEGETEFEYINSIDEDKTPIIGEALIQLEIAYQLKRIADRLIAWECEGALATFECNSAMKK